jgi:hypothetical protein
MDPLVTDGPPLAFEVAVKVVEQFVPVAIGPVLSLAAVKVAEYMVEVTAVTGPKEPQVELFAVNATPELLESFATVTITGCVLVPLAFEASMLPGAGVKLTVMLVGTTTFSATMADLVGSVTEVAVAVAEQTVDGAV